jgi:hypothetical protein
MSETASDPKERQILEAGIDYVFERSDGQECPFCGARMGIGEEANPKAMKSHLRGKHPNQCTMALAQDSLNPVIVEKITEDDIHALAGIQLVDELDRFDALYVPKEIRQDAKKRGDVLRWAAPEKVRRMMDQGAEVVKLSKGEAASKVQGSTEDSNMRANEMTLMRIPEALAQKRAHQKRSRIEQQLSASKEAYEAGREGVEKLVYDSYISKGQSKETAGQVARAISGRADREYNNHQGGRTSGRDPNAREGITIINQSGTRSL